MEFQGVHQNLRKKHGFPGGQCKKKDGSRQISGGRVKVVGIPGGTPKIEGKTWISWGVDVKKWKIPRGVTLHLIKSSKDQLQENSQQGGGVQFFFLEKPITSSHYQFSKGDRTRDLSILNSTP